MKEEKVVINEKTYTVKEIKYKDFVSQAADVMQNDRSSAGKVVMILATGMTDEEYDNLSMKEGLEIMQVVNKLNSVGDFQIPQPSKELETI